MYIAFYWLKMWLFNLGYESGTKLITTLGEKLMYLQMQFQSWD